MEKIKTERELKWRLKKKKIGKQRLKEAQKIQIQKRYKIKITEIFFFFWAEYQNLLEAKKKKKRKKKHRMKM